MAHPETAEPVQFPCGSYTVSVTGNVVVSAMPANFPRVIMEVIGKIVLRAFASARELDTPLTELAADFAGLEIRARDIEDGAVIFLTPREY